MECVRAVVDSSNLRPILSLPRSFWNRKLEIIITPVEDTPDEGAEKVISDCIADALARYRIVSGKEFNGGFPSALRQQLVKLPYKNAPLISIRDDSVKVTLFYGSEKYIIDYKDICPDIVIISRIRMNPDGKRIIEMKETPVGGLCDFFEAADE